VAEARPRANCQILPGPGSRCRGRSRSRRGLQYLMVRRFVREMGALGGRGSKREPVMAVSVRTRAAIVPPRAGDRPLRSGCTSRSPSVTTCHALSFLTGSPNISRNAECRNSSSSRSSPACWCRIASALSRIAAIRRCSAGEAAVVGTRESRAQLQLGSWRRWRGRLSRGQT